MLIVFIYSILIVILVVPFSLIIIKNDNTDFYTYSKSLIFGIIIISSIALIINFFVALNLYVTSMFILASVILIFKFPKKFINIKFLRFVIIQGFIIFILILESNVYRPDAGLYHLPFIGIINTEKLIIGLYNLHSRYAHISAIQYFSAASNNMIFKNNGIVFIQALIAAGVISNFSGILLKNIKQNNYNYHHYFISFVLIFIFYKMNRYSEYGNDAPAHFLYFFLISEILISIENKKKYFLDNLLISVFIIQNKIMLLPVVIFNLIDFKLASILNYIKSFKFLILFIIFISWLIKNLLILGCLIYPVKITCPDQLLWGNTNLTTKISVSGEAWAKGWSDLNDNERNIIGLEKFIKGFNWINAWKLKHLKLINQIMFPYLLIITIIFTFYFHKSEKNLKKINKNYFYLLLLSIFPIIIWFLKAPLFRYGYSTIITSLSLLFSLFLCSRVVSVKKIKYTSTFIFLIGFLIIFSKNILRISQNDNDYYNYPWPKFYSMTPGNNPENYYFKKIGSTVLSFPSENYCMYSKTICSHYKINKNLKILNKNYLIMYLE